ncbi:Gfo/Idh/MocA family oxidoreductase [Halostella sp. PRR32]|uniref:Gfo/Idh/MocA family protein n=1 Tax=Halostella sp. PRR32 TaxID=3098147 RepID=UPI002B1E1C43|nr:Gfo/Idh/MocA family oxidoreductase [Halostella sp. PRR32]
MDERTLRVGIVGLGYIGRTVGGQFHRHDGATVAAVADIAEETLSEIGDEFDVPTDARYAEYERMLENEALDAVLVGTPHTLHYEQVVRALERNLHVYCDKPLTTSLSDARELADRMDGSDRTLMVGYQRHLNTAFRTARRRWAGELEPRWMTAEITQDWAERFDDTWRMNPDLSGGGYLYDTGSHLLDGLLWITDLTPSRVRADMTFADDDRRVDTRATLEIAFEEGATATVSVNGDAPCTREHVHVWDDEGAVYLDGRQWETRQLRTVDAENTEHKPYIDRESLTTRAAAFVEAVRTGDDPPATARDALRVTAVTEAAYESAREGGWVDVNAE